MDSSEHEVFVISDLHLGGFGQKPGPGDRGFRMFTQTQNLASFISGVAARPSAELVINGDFIDFLAEGTGDGVWLPFIEDESVAAEALQRVIKGEKPVFSALAKLVQSGKRLVILLGNHDLELSFPRVRNELCRELGVVEGSGIRFILDGEAYSIGDVLIEHGNRYDPLNVVDVDGLRRLRSLQSRGQERWSRRPFEPPIGSRLVASVFNHYKWNHAFIDLLQPLRQATLPLTLALVPSAIKDLPKLYPVLKWWRHEVDSRCVPQREQEIASSFERPLFPPEPRSSEIPELKPEEMLRLLSPTLTREDASELASLILEEATNADQPTQEEIAFKASERINQVIESQKLRLLALSFKSLQHDQSFDVHNEPQESRYLKCARCLADLGWKNVIFGHTHAAKDVQIGGKARYLNTGTWTDTMRIPADLVRKEVDEIRDLLPDFLKHLRRRDYSALESPQAHYALIRTSNRGVLSVELLRYPRGPSP